MALGPVLVGICQDWHAVRVSGSRYPAGSSDPRTGRVVPRFCPPRALWPVRGPVRSGAFPVGQIAVGTVLVALCVVLTGCPEDPNVSGPISEFPVLGDGEGIAPTAAGAVPGLSGDSSALPPIDMGDSGTAITDPQAADEPEAIAEVDDSADADESADDGASAGGMLPDSEAEQAEQGVMDDDVAPPSADAGQLGDGGVPLDAGI